jgi:hypothetical protein
LGIYYVPGTGPGLGNKSTNEQTKLLLRLRIFDDGRKHSR